MFFFMDIYKKKCTWNNHQVMWTKHILIWFVGLGFLQNVKLSADEGDLMEDTTMYICIVGSLIYMTITRPNLSYAVRVVSQFMQTPQATFGCSEAHTEVHKTYFALWNFL
jgi:hypothetical protein